MLRAGWDTFTDYAWPHTPALVSTLPDHIAAAIDWAELQSVPSSLPQKRFVCKVWSVGEGDEHRQVRSGASSAPAHLGAGSTVVWDDFRDAGISDVLAQMASDLRSPVHKRQADVLHTPEGSNVSPHFDCHEVCILQVSGRKRWWLAPNEHVHCPSRGYLERGGRDRLRSESARWPLTPPTRDQMRSFTLSPGELLFVPRGWWHATRALEDSLSVTLFFKCLTNRDLDGPGWTVDRCVPKPGSAGVALNGCGWVTPDPVTADLATDTAL